jgi:hypothetical protein
VKATLGYSQQPSPRKENPLGVGVREVIKVTARVFHSPVLFSLLFLVSLAAVLITHDREDMKG